MPPAAIVAAVTPAALCGDGDTPCLRGDRDGDWLIRGLRLPGDRERERERDGDGLRASSGRGALRIILRPLCVEFSSMDKYPRAFARADASTRARGLSEAAGITGRRGDLVGDATAGDTVAPSDRRGDLL